MKEKGLLRKSNIRLTILFILGSLAVVLVVLFLNNQTLKFNEQTSTISDIINVSGRQRMLSQNIAKTSLKLERNLTDKSLLILDSLVNQFTVSHELLKSVNQDLSGNRIARLESLFREIDPLVYEMEKYALEISETQTVSSEVMESILTLEQAILPIMESITRTYADIGSQLFEEIEVNIYRQNLFIILAIFLSAGSVLLFTIKTVKSYSDSVIKLQGDLEHSLNSREHEIEKLKFLTSTINVGVWEKSFVEGGESWSENLYKVLGYEPYEFQGTADLFREHVHPDDLLKLDNASRESITKGDARTLEIRVRKKTGEYRWVEANGNAKKDQNGKLRLLVGGVIDIHQKKIYEVQLKSFVDLAPAPIAMFDAEMRYIFASKQWIDLYSLQGKNVIGEYHYKLLSKTGQFWKDRIEKCLAGEVLSGGEESYRGRNGEEKWIKWEMRPWYINSDHISGVIVYTQNITESVKKKLELEASKEVAEAASKAKELFLATMSHEIRTPINAVLGSTDLLRSENPREDQKQYLDLLKFSGENLLNLINDILDISKIESGEFNLQEKPFDLTKLTNQVIDLLSFSANENLVRLSIDYDQKLSKVFLGDGPRLSQVITNLMSNAIKFSRGGNVGLKVSYVSSNRDQQVLDIAIKDSGIGIDKEDQEKIFKAFEQVDMSSTRKYGGTGLGLFIVQNLLKAMDSEIKLYSKVGEGSVFSFQLTLHTTTEAIEGSISDISWSRFEHKSVKILIAEDNRANSLILEKLLDKGKIIYDTVENGELAIQAVKTKQYDMVLMDLQMPKMDGFEATRQIRKMSGDYFREIPIVALTADAFTEVKQRAENVGMTGYLTKPFKPVELMLLIEENYQTLRIQPRKNTSNFSKIVDELTEGDQDFQTEFVGNLSRSYKDFIIDFKDSVLDEDLNELKKAIHKIKPLNEILQLDTLVSDLRELVTFGESFASENKLVQTILDHLEGIKVQISDLSENATDYKNS